MIIILFLEASSIIALLLTINLASKKYFLINEYKTQDSYLFLGLVLMLLYYIIHLVLLIFNIYNPSLLYLAYSFKTYSFWGFSSFFLSQMFFQNTKVFKALKIGLLLSFFIVVNIVWSYSSIINKDISNSHSLLLNLSGLPNVYCDLVYKLIWIISSLGILVWIRHFTYMAVKFLYGSAVCAVLSYSMSIFNILKFNGFSYPLFFLFYIFGTASLFFMIVVVFIYFKDEKTKKDLLEKELKKTEKILKYKKDF